MAGLTAQGFSIYTQDDLEAQVSAAIFDSIGISLGALAGSGLGQLVAILCERFAELWQALQSLYMSQTADGAGGVRLDDICALTGTLREPATSSTVTMTMTGVPTTLVSAGSQAKTLSTNIVAQSLVDATITAVAAWGVTTAYVSPVRVTNAGNVYQATTSGVSAGSGGGPTTTDPAIADNTVVWKYLGPGTAAIDAAGAAVLTGPLQMAAGDLTVKVTAVFGWLGVTNVDDATPGTNAMTDEALRVLREAELAAPGDETVDAIRADILDLTGVISCTVFENAGDTTDGDGRPPHSVEALVRGGADQDIYDQLLSSVAAGIATTGTSTGSAVDSQGVTHIISFSRPTPVIVSAYVTVAYDPEVYPADGDASIQLAIVAFGDLQNTGKDAVPSSVNAQAFTVDGVDDASTLLYTDAIAAPVAWAAATAYVATVGARSVVTSDGGRAYICTTAGMSSLPAPTGVGTGIVDGGGVVWDFLGATIPVGLRFLAEFSTTRIVVVSTPMTP